MTVMVSGSEAAFALLQPVLDAVAANVYRVGSDIGLGSTVKIIHQLLARVHIAVGAEAMALAARAGLPLETMYEVVTNAGYEREDDSASSAASPCRRVRRTPDASWSDSR